MNKIISLAASSLLLSLTFCACGGGSNSDSTSRSVPISINQSAFNSITDATFSNSTCTNLPLETAVGIFASSTGTSGAAGTLEDPLDLATALSAGSPVQAGDTLWLLEGIYTGHFTSELAGTSIAPIKIKPLPGKQAILNGNTGTRGSALLIEGEWADFYGLEVLSSSTMRTSTQDTSSPTDIIVNDGVNVQGPNTRVINFIEHDNTGGGVSSWSNAPDSEVYGNIIYNNGWTAPGRGHGHAIYAQNDTGYKKLTNNTIFFGFATGIHVYTEGGQMNNFDVQHNTWFMTGASDPRASQRKDNCLIGGFQLVINLTLSNNQGFSMNGRGTRLGYSSGVLDQTGSLDNNYLSENFWVEGTWSSFPISNTTVLRGLTGSASDYISDGVNANIVQETPPLTGKKVFVKENDHDPRRAKIAIYNYDEDANVSVNLSSVLVVGEAYRIHSTFALFGTAMLEGLYDGGLISIPMGSIEPPQPFGLDGIDSVDDDPHRKFGTFILTHGGCQ